MRWFTSAFLALMSLGFLGLIGAVGAAALVISHYSKDLPDHSQLTEYEPSIITRIYAGDGRLLAEYAQEKRVFVPIESIPDRVVQAFLSAEDQNFYRHKGIDPLAIARAAVTNLRNVGTGRRLIGASTITQQVAKNFLLTNEISYERKIKEAILALRLEKALSKEQLLELYLNEIYLGHRAYGVAAAGLMYFDKSLEDLSLAEAAYLAALPKAPNNYHPVKNHEAALARRNWVLERMAEDGYITASQADLAQKTPLAMRMRDTASGVDAPFFAEEVRRELKDRYGPESLYQGGLTVRTTVDPHLQDIAQEALRYGLASYDRRHGWRGPVAALESLDDWAAKLADIPEPEGMLQNWRLAVVLKAGGAQAELGFADKTRDTLALSGVKWARKCLQECYALGPEISAVNQVVQPGDVIMVAESDPEKLADAEEDETEITTAQGLELQQIPLVQGSIIALDPHTGRVLAMQGGWKYGPSQFNRATQAWRQPGSAFKPFVYLPALDQGFTPATLVLDAPFVVEQAPGDYWRPSNYSGDFYGPTPIRVGIEKSKNLMTVRLADYVGMETVVEYAKRFGIADQMKPLLSYALGAGETTLLRLTTAYGMLANGGKYISPAFIDRIQDRRGRTVFSHDVRPCPNCGPLIRWEGQGTPAIPDMRAQIADERTVYQIVSILEGVIQRGTGRRIASLGRPLAGKTGTTNESRDTWFIGFSPDLVVGVFIGFDEPRSLGKRETGSSVAAPVFKKFMGEALADTPPIPFRVPPGVRHVRTNAETGRAARAGDPKVIWEAFVTGTEPNADDYVLDTKVIAGGQMVNPYGDGMYGYEQGYGNDSYGYDGTGGYGSYGGNAGYGYDQPPASSSYYDPYTPQQQRQYPYTQPPVRQPPPQPSPSSDPAFTGTGGLY